MGLSSSPQLLSLFVLNKWYRKSYYFSPALFPRDCWKINKGFPIHDGLWQGHSGNKDRKIKLLISALFSKIYFSLFFLIFYKLKDYNINKNTTNIGNDLHSIKWLFN